VTDGSLFLAASPSAQVVFNNTCPSHQPQGPASSSAAHPTVALSPVTDGLTLAAYDSAKGPLALMDSNTSQCFYLLSPALLPLVTPTTSFLTVALPPVTNGTTPAALPSAHVHLVRRNGTLVFRELHDCASGTDLSALLPMQFVVHVEWTAWDHKAGLRIVLSELLCMIWQQVAVAAGNFIAIPDAQRCLWCVGERRALQWMLWLSLPGGVLPVQCRVPPSCGDLPCQQSHQTLNLYVL